MSIIVDKEFQSLIPPLSPEEFEQLEKNCIEDGIRDPLVVWNHGSNDILVDGHNRWRIVGKHPTLEFSIKRMTFADRDAVTTWIISNQLGRRNLSAYDRSILALKLKPVIAEKAKERQAQAGRGEDVPKSAQAKTRDELATIAGVSHDTIHKVETIEKKATDKTKQLVREGKLSINQAYNSVHEKREDPVKQARKEHEEFQEKKKSSVVGFREAQLDKINKEILDNALLQDVLSVLNKVDEFGQKHRPEDLEVLRDHVPDDEKGFLINRCEICKRIITAIMMSMA